MRRVVAEGASVVFVSHDIDEVMEITDRATILRDGVVVGVLETKRATRGAISSRRIVGRSVKPFHVHALDGRARASPRRASRTRSRAGLGPISFEVGKGEILGLTGLIGSGFDRVCAALLRRRRAPSGAG